MDASLVFFPRLKCSEGFFSQEVCVLVGKRSLALILGRDHFSDDPSHPTYSFPRKRFPSTVFPLTDGLHPRFPKCVQSGLQRLPRVGPQSAGDTLGTQISPDVTAV